MPHSDIGQMSRYTLVQVLTWGGGALRKHAPEIAAGAGWLPRYSTVATDHRGMALTLRSLRHRQAITFHLEKARMHVVVQNRACG
jgi:hypothetical protein